MSKSVLLYLVVERFAVHSKQLSRLALVVFCLLQGLDDALPLPLARYNFLACLDILYDKEQVAVWTYENHWTHTTYDGEDYWEYVLDIYELGGSGRDQLSPGLGDQIADYIVQGFAHVSPSLVIAQRSMVPVRRIFF